MKPIGKDQIIAAINALEDEYNEEKRQIPDSGLFELNLKYLREAVFRRWIWGLDIGRFDLMAIKEEHDQFYLVSTVPAGEEELIAGRCLPQHDRDSVVRSQGSGRERYLTCSPIPSAFARSTK